MAEASSSRAPAKEPKSGTAHIDGPEKELYDACDRVGNPNKIWFQDDLQALDCMQSKDLHYLVGLIAQLTTRCLFRNFEANGRPCWKVVKADLAASLYKLTEVERMIYYELEAVGSDGLWTKVLKQRTGLQLAEVQNSLKKLDTKGFVKQFTSAKFPTKKLFILSHLQPSEEAAGGLFFTDGQVDTDLLSHLMKWTEVFVHRRAWEIPARTANAEKNGKRKREDQDDPVDSGILHGSKRWKGVKPMPASYQGYATVPEIAKYLNKAGILLKDKIMEAEVVQVLELLEYDGRLEKVGSGNGFRTLLRPIANPYQAVEEPPRNGMSEVPCGGCPQFDLCDETGPVNAKTCEYFEQWF